MEHGRGGGQAPAVPLRRCAAVVAFAGDDRTASTRILRRGPRAFARMADIWPALAARARTAWPIAGEDGVPLRRASGPQVHRRLEPERSARRHRRAAATV